ncbi:hypothetical protein DH2020_000679 [Rehmannia glutinosa]|uniref:Integrase zinc-binding domain-containing protein n=1 Tax=Rehmannia glutinosa TaxID=99300 RepID=A0ABR0XXM7_REHGL
MYRDLKEIFWWRSMKRDIGSFVARCLTCQQVKAEHQRPSGLLKPLEIPEWKWGHITMDFVVGLPLSVKKNNALWVIVRRVTKSRHFLTPKKMTLKMDQYAKIYVKEIVRLHTGPCDVEFAYNNSYQATIEMAPYEALYGQKCRSPLYWSEVGEKKILGLELVQQTVEKIEKVRDRMKVAQSRHKSYADRWRKDLQLDVGEKVFMKVAPMRGVFCFGEKGKLKPRYIGTFGILRRICELAYC